MIATLVSMGSTSATAQLGFLDKVFEKGSDVNVSYQVGRALRGNDLMVWNTDTWFNLDLGIRTGLAQLKGF